MNQFNFKIEVEIPAEAVAKLESAAARALKTVAAELDGRFMDAISSTNWAWPRKSKRGTQGATLGDTARKWKAASFNTGSPRSIVDSGDLKASRDYNLSNVTAEWSWTVEYAAAVHDGAWIYPWANDQAAKVLLPARPWTEAVLFGHPHYSGETYPFSDRLTQEITKQAR